MIDLRGITDGRGGPREHTSPLRKVLLAVAIEAGETRRGARLALARRGLLDAFNLLDATRTSISSKRLVAVRIGAGGILTSGRKRSQAVDVSCSGGRTVALR